MKIQKLPRGIELDIEFEEEGQVVFRLTARMPDGVPISHSRKFDYRELASVKTLTIHTMLEQLAIGVGRRMVFDDLLK